MKIINKVEIKYFRSIYTLTLKGLRPLNVFAGQNDMGKSNILKALNLFFNGNTDWQRPIDFYRDFSIERLQRVRKSIKGKQYISVAVEFNRPDNYAGSLPKKFKVTRTWHRDTTQYLERTDISSQQDKLPSTLDVAQRFYPRLLNRIHFEYVPAVKDRNYFEHLLSSLQETLLDIPTGSDEAILEISEGLATLIESKVGSLQTDFQRATGLQSAIEPPDDIASLFRAFRVVTGDESNKLPLTMRGDGIQARYVPSVLQYISNSSNDFFIWGFEEPENSLEYGLVSEMGEDFANLYSKGAQIFLTSHSPALTSIKEKNVASFRVYLEEGLTNAAMIWPGKSHGRHTSQLALDLGVMELTDELHNEYQLRVKELEDLSESVSALEEVISKHEKPLVLVEGKTDRLILDCAWEKLFGDEEKPFVVREAFATGDDKDATSGGVGYLRKSIETIHPRDNRRAIAIFDHDVQGIRKGFQKLDANFVEMSGVPNSKKHKNGIAFAMLLPVPDFRKEFAEQENLCIEFMFPDDAIAQKNDDGNGLELEKPELVLSVKGNKRLPIESDEIYDKFGDESLTGASTRIVSGKTTFADSVVPNLDGDYFDAFRAVFEKIMSILAL